MNIIDAYFCLFVVYIFLLYVRGLIDYLKLFQAGTQPASLITINAAAF